MMETPEPVLIWIPLMKDLGMSWNEIKCTPAFELRGILALLMNMSSSILWTDTRTRILVKWRKIDQV